MRIKINTKNIAKKLSAVSCKLSAFRKLKVRLSVFKNLQPTTYNLQPNRGFTLVELLVTLSLFVILTTIVLFSQQKFNGSILLTNLAYDVALTIRQAQTYGINVREAPQAGGFQRAYGIYIDKSKNDKRFILFSDKQDNGRYQGNIDCKSSADICVNSYNIKRGNKISDIKVTSTDTGCSPSCSVDELNITFKRPDPDAIFTAKKGSYFSNITEAKIILSSANGDNRNVIINSTGQISVNRGI